MAHSRGRVKRRNVDRSVVQFLKNSSNFLYDVAQRFEAYFIRAF
jgi:hypothetical protein